MKYEILKDFKGSQDGRFAEDFKAGTQAELSDYLAACAPPGSIRQVTAAAAVAVEVDNKAIVTDGKPRRTMSKARRTMSKAP